MPPLRLLDLEEPLEPAEFPNGRTFAVRPLDAAGYALWEEVKTTGDDATALQLLRHIVPDATDDDFAVLSPRMVQGVILHAMRKLKPVLDALEARAKNGDAPAPETTTPLPRRRSKPKTR